MQIAYICIMKVTKMQIEYMIKNYVINRKNTYQIAKDLNLTSGSVQYQLKKNNIRLSPQSYKFNEDYFKNIDTSNKAYFLGLIYADGSVYKNSCKIKLVETDSYILEIFKKDVESKKPLNYRKSEIIKGTSYIGKPQYSIELCSKILVEDLKNLGVHQNKSLTLTFPNNIPTYFMSDFIRGCFDGDGCIYNSQNRIMINYTGSQKFCEGFCEWLDKTLNIKAIAKKDSRGNSWYFYILKIKNVISFCNFIYSNENCVKLERKYLKFKNYEQKV